eukprot:2702033-Amphidinium_carterae.2
MAQESSSNLLEDSTGEVSQEHEILEGNLEVGSNAMAVCAIVDHTSSEGPSSNTDAVPKQQGVTNMQPP